MMRAKRFQRLIAAGAAVMLTVSGCAFEGLNSLPLPGAVGRGSDAKTYRVQFANIGTLESNSPVLINDVVVGSVKKMTFSNWHVDVDVSIQPDVAVPANAVASIGQTSLLGSMHVALDPPVGQAPAGQLPAGATIPLDKSTTYPSTEQTLSSLSTVVNGGGLGQIGDIIHNFNAALNGREGDVRELLTRLDDFIGVLNAQRANIIASLQALNRLGGTFANQTDVIEQVLQKVPPALDVLVRERPRITTALDKLRVFSDTTTQLVNNTQADLVTDLQHLQPTIKALADVGDGLDHALAYTGVFPYGQALIDRGLRGDYMNLFDILDFTVPRLKRTTFLGTRWGEDGAALVPAPGEPYYLNYAYDPLLAPISPPPAGVPPPPPPPPGAGPVPPAGSASAAMVPMSAGAPVPPPGAPIFAGPYEAPAAPAQAPVPAGGGG